jgi:16S rRNA (guanine527-N7)-methyltransferase
MVEYNNRIKRESPIRPITSILADRLAPLPFSLDRTNVPRLSAYLHLLFQWNEQFHFTNYSSAEIIIDKLLLPSLVFSVLIQDGRKVLDLGSGPGIPAIPLAILRGDINVTSLESSSKAVEFMKTCKTEMSLDNLEVIEGRAEEVAQDSEVRETFDQVMARAFAPIPIVLEIGAAFLKVDGILTAQSSGKVSTRIVDCEPEMAEVGCRLGRAGAILMGNEESEPVFFLEFVKESTTSDQYPRSWKKMRNQPLWE